MEHGFLKAPWEELVRTFRAGHKPVARDAELAAAATTRDSQEEVVARLETLRRRMVTARDADAAAMSRCLVRIQHLKDRSAEVGVEQMDVDGVDPAEREMAAADTVARWEKSRLDRILIDYMLREGLYESAANLAASEKIEMLVDLDIFAQSRVVIEALRRRDCAEALRWCTDNKRRLQKVHSKLEFRLRLQEMVEHARAGRNTDAIAYVRKHLATGSCDPETMSDIQRVMALLIFHPNTPCQPYKDMFSERRWLELEAMFKQDNYRLYGLTRESTLEIMLKAGLASLKTRKCGTEANRKPNCPTCNEPYLSLAQALPRGRHENSILVCSITGSIMDENNPPMALPNGNVYSYGALEAMSHENDGRITDPKTSDTFRLSELRKCFIM